MASAADYEIPMNALEAFYDEPGERGWILEGYKHGLTTTSVIVTETAPGGGPPLHLHHTEEIHVLPECQMGYVMGETIFEVTGPCLMRIPAALPHTFLNRGRSPVRLVCFFPAYNFWTNYEELGPNPLIGRQASDAADPK
jgi:mannose-6-phosphate isomerase-like protein (cupin superfamily)